MVSQAQKNADAKWKKANTKTIMLRLFYKTDKDIIDYLENKEGKMAFIRQAIRNEMKKEGK